MKIKLILFAVMLISFAAFAQEVPVPSDEPVSKVPEFLQPFVELLGGKGPVATTVIMWIMTLSVGFASFAVWIRNKIADAMNKIVESDGKDDDDKLRAIFSKGWYRTMAFAFNFINIRFPTLAELERAIALQEEAVKKATE